MDLSDGDCIRLIKVKLDWVEVKEIPSLLTCNKNIPINHQAN